MSKQRLYVAYGSNLNIQQMKYRCPTAKLFATGVIKDYELQFKGSAHGAFATIGKKEGASVPVGVWEIQPRDEMSLDRYEGYPSHYFKQNIPVELQDGRTINGMVYIMNLQMKYGIPHNHYVQTVCQGYLDCNLNTGVLKDAIVESAKEYYVNQIQGITAQLQTRKHRLSQTKEDDFEEEVSEEDIDEDLDEGDEEGYGNYNGLDDFV